MRKILFRGKDVRTGYWKEGSLVREWLGVDMGYTIRDVPDHFNQIAFRSIVDPKTIGEFSGLTDKDGRKIFEGDIIHVNYTISAPVGTGPLLRIVKHSIDYKSVVAFENCRFCLKKQNGEIFEMHLVSGEVEIIGNIHDNPELLEVDE